ncbi:UDP-N-acetylglucosamine 1-carboxyvinyltransferase [Chondromyces crocatus]|uniref:UDP-N-acetylglucosamine 1-carboxyvinyltransferase n=2 Tax=Chondromyces crocatus TaxID=52 RepID=A0A0K1E8N4_CHOCO|nr:UDP-N-acetylglucosamine 1-carboxyvinyltransferase [Chondromyces crocatus]
MPFRASYDIAALMDAIRIRGGQRLSGKIHVSGAKNAALPILCATLLSDGESLLRNVPALRDIDTTAALLRFLGRPVDCAPPLVRVDAGSQVRPEAPYELVKQMRASVLVLGPLLARHGRAKVSLPGGCQIGTRPVDQHLKGLEAMGATIRLERGYIVAECKRLRGSEVVFDLPTVTGTENLMMAAALAKGRTTLVNCAREPEVEELGRVLNKMGARVSGAGTDVIHIEGADELEPFDHAIISDRIEAGTYMVAAAAAGGDVLLEGAPLEDLEAVAAKLRQAGVEVGREGDCVRIRRDADRPLRPVDITTAPHPGFPTDMQAQFMVLMCLARGTSRIAETIFENRFMHVPELVRMGAQIDVDGHTAHVHGGHPLSGASVMATDLRASASLIIAGLVAAEETEVLRVYHLDRGYEHMERKLAQLGADTVRVSQRDG